MTTSPRFLLRAQVTQAQSPYTARPTELVIVTGDGTFAPMAITLPLAASSPGTIICVKNQGGGDPPSITVSPSGADTIDGAVSYVMSPRPYMSPATPGLIGFDTVLFASDGVSEWSRIGFSPLPPFGITDPALMAFAGGITGQAAGTTTGFLANTLPSGTANSASALRYRLKNTVQSVERLKVRVLQNNLTTSTTVTVMKDGVATGVTLTVGAGATGDFQDLLNSNSFNAGQGLDIRVENTNGGAGNTIQLTAVVEVR